MPARRLGAFVAEGDWGWSDWRGGGDKGKGCVGLSQGNWERETGR